jgi:hypothetical protein
MGSSQRLTSRANSWWSSCVFTRHIVSSSLREHSRESIEIIPIMRR